MSAKQLLRLAIFFNLLLIDLVCNYYHEPHWNGVWWLAFVSSVKEWTGSTQENLNFHSEVLINSKIESLFYFLTRLLGLAAYIPNGGILTHLQTDILKCHYMTTTHHLLPYLITLRLHPLASKAEKDIDIILLHALLHKQINLGNTLPH